MRGSLPAKGHFTIDSIYGHLTAKNKLDGIKVKVLETNYLDEMEEVAKDLHNYYYIISLQ